MSEDTRFRCNLCGTKNEGRPRAEDREVPNCTKCGSTIRTRSVMHALSQELFGFTLPAGDFPRLPGIRGLGISDSVDYAELLEKKFSYSNTWYHREPHFDVTDVPDNERNRYDFIICSEVLEHVAPPLEPVFRNLYRMLKPNGFLLVTVPYTLAENTTEHFPKLNDYGLARLNESLVLVNRTVGGRLEVHENLVFHGGEGSTLELRVYSERDLRRHMKIAGFREVQFYSEDAPAWGIAHTGWSLPFSARKEPFALPLSSAADWAEQWASALSAIRDQSGEIVFVQSALAQISSLQEELKSRTEWAKKLDVDIEVAASRISELETELEKRTEWAQSNEKQLHERTEWALSLERDLNEHVRIAQTLQEETRILKERLERANAELTEIQHSRALRVGRKLGLS